MIGMVIVYQVRLRLVTALRKLSFPPVKIGVKIICAAGVQSRHLLGYDWLMKRRKPRRPRNAIALGMLLSRKGGPMRDRRSRRAKDARHDPTRQQEH
ncbi:MAG TPA: hypothetical protein DCP73_13280 [Chloroflexi bacterium]|nr:hypothetical protein [Chloroflexota bacterium]